MLLRPAWSGHVVRKGAALVIRFRKARWRDSSGGIRGPDARDEVVIEDRVISGAHAILVRLIAYYIEASRVGAREVHDIFIDVPCPLPLLSSIERECLRLDRTGAVALRPRDKEPVERHGDVARDMRELRRYRFLVGASGRNYAQECSGDHRGSSKSRPQVLRVTHTGSLSVL